LCRCGLLPLVLVPLLSWRLLPLLPVPLRLLPVSLVPLRLLPLQNINACRQFDESMNVANVRLATLDFVRNSSESAFWFVDPIRTLPYATYVPLLCSVSPYKNSYFEGFERSLLMKQSILLIFAFVKIITTC
jgi:hypothetical protein